MPYITLDLYKQRMDAHFNSIKSTLSPIGTASSKRKKCILVIRPGFGGSHIPYEVSQACESPIMQTIQSLRDFEYVLFTFAFQDTPTPGLYSLEQSCEQYREAISPLVTDSLGVSRSLAGAAFNAELGGYLNGDLSFEFRSREHWKMK